MTTTLELYDDAVSFLAQAVDHLALDPVLNTVVATYAEREAREERATSPGPPHWYAVVRHPDGEVAGVAMRTAPLVPYPLFVLPMPDDAAVRLARLLHERGEEVGGANGALRVASEVDVGLALTWYAAFHADVDELAGRSAGQEGEMVTPEVVLRRLRAGRLFLLEVDGLPVHLTGQSDPSYGACDWVRCTPRVRTAVGATRARRSRSCPGGSSPTDTGPASSPTRPTRCRTGLPADRIRAGGGHGQPAGRRRDPRSVDSEHDV